MNHIDSTYRAQDLSRKHAPLSRMAAILAALALSIALAFCLGAAQGESSQAFATIYPAGESSQVDDQADAAGDADADDGAGASEAEILDDEGTPLSSGLGGGEPVSGGVGFGPIAIVGIAGVALFFLVLMRRLNANIKDMSRMFK